MKEKYMIDYSQGRYVVKDSSGQVVGRIDEDGFVRNGMDLLYRVDGDEFYIVNGGLVGFIENGRVVSPQGQFKFVIEAE
jgi:hypothetical protein